MAQVKIRKRDKTFSYIFEAGKIDGKSKVVEKGEYPTKAAAYKAGVEAYINYLHGNIRITSESITLKDFMTNWLENVVSLNIKATTLQEYQSRFQNHIVPYFGETKVHELTSAMLDKWLRKLLQKGPAQKTLSVIHALIHNEICCISRAKLISSNPAAYIRAPKNALKNVIKRMIITPERFKALLEKYPFGTPYYIPLLLLYHTGEGLNAHSFRHTHAIQLIENGADPNGVAGRLGHSKTNVTQDLYIHNTSKLQEKTAAIFAENLQTNS